VFYLGDLTDHQECYYQIRSHHFLYSLNRQILAFKTHEIIDHIIYYFRNAAVKIKSIDVAETIKTTKALIETEASLSVRLVGGHGQSGYQ
jgi:predicted ABC-class ATPase